MITNHKKNKKGNNEKNNIQLGIEATKEPHK